MMPEYTIYDRLTGEVMQILTAGPETLWIDMRAGQSFVLGRLDPADGYFDGDAWTLYTPAQAAAKADRPSYWHRWSNSAMGWLDARARDALIADLSDRVNARREAVLRLPILVDQLEIDADAMSVAMLQGRISAMRERVLAGLTVSHDTLVWRDAGNVTHAWDSQGDYLAWLVAAALAIEARSTAIYMYSWNLKAKLEAADDPASIDIHHGWPVAG